MTVWYVALCRTCNDIVRCFKTVEERADWMRKHARWRGVAGNHADFWQADTSPEEH